MPKEQKTDGPVIVHRIVATGDTIQQVVFYHNSYFCITEDNRFICLDNQFNVDTTLTRNNRKIRPSRIFMSGDTLIAITFEEKMFDSYYLDTSNIWKHIYDRSLFSRKEPLFQDDRFIVTSCCSGEFGGSVFFKDKHTGSLNACPATCAVAVHNIAGTYYLVNSLAHISGFTDILKIVDPHKLYLLEADSVMEKCQDWYLRNLTYRNNYAGSEKYEIGTQKILDTGRVIALMSFVYKDQLYCLSSSDSFAFVSKLNKGKLVYSNSIGPGYYSVTGSGEIITRDNVTVATFENKGITGFLAVHNDTVTEVRFQNPR